MPREFDFVATLPIDSNIAFLEYPQTVGRLRYSTLHAWKTGEVYLVNVAVIDIVECLTRGPKLEIGAFCALYFLQVADGIVSVGHDDPADLATWKILPDSSILLYRYALTEYPLDPEAENDAEVVRLIDGLGRHGKLVAHKRTTGAEVQCLNFRG